MVLKLKQQVGKLRFPVPIVVQPIPNVLLAQKNLEFAQVANANTDGNDRSGVIWHKLKNFKMA
jgi:hypothetical protein